MGAKCCTGNNPQQPTVDIFKKINKNDMELIDEIYELMDNALLTAGPTGKFTTTQYVKIVELHNEYFKTNLNKDIYKDLMEAVLNMKSLYYKIKRNELEIEENSNTNLEEVVTEEKVDESIEEKKCEVCGEKLHFNTKKTICKKCQNTD